MTSIGRTRAGGVETASGAPRSAAGQALQRQLREHT